MEFSGSMAARLGLEGVAYPVAENVNPGFN